MIKVKLVLIISLVILVDLTTDLIPVQAQVTPSLQLATVPAKPPSRGTPPRRTPMGTRGPCEETKLPFTPVLPVSESGFSGFTLAEYPTFWFYIPYNTNTVNSGRFVVEDQEENLIYRTEFKLPKTPGFVSISIPTTANPLEKGKQYNWTLVLNCASPDSQNSDQPNFVSHQGMIERVDMESLEAQLKTAPLAERLNLYIDNQIWYDATTELLQIRDVPPAWRNLLRAIDLEELEQNAIAGSIEPIEK